MKVVAAICCLFTALLTSLPAYSADPQYFQAPIPNWVIERSFDPTIEIPTDEISGGVFYRIVDDQIRISKSGEKTYFSQLTETVINPKGLDNSSQIDISFDPSYQTLTIHDISVIRDGVKYDRLHSSEISVFQSEQDAAKRIYDGSLTFSAIINDVTVGDTVSYSYSTQGFNPVYKGIFSTGRTLVWGTPVQDQYHRVVWEKETPLYVTQRNSQFPVNEQVFEDRTEYSMHIHMVEPLIYSDQSPSWFLPRATIYYSESPNWEHVTNWASTLYEDLGINSAVKNLAAEIASRTNDQKVQLQLALQYVQDKIRYVGIETGLNSHLPTPAYETLDLKYGDCKDKSVLLLALMKELKIEGYPALVNTELLKTLNELPSAVSRFDHVIVQAKVAGNVYWLDPTYTNQQGPIDSIFQPNYGFALVVNDGSKTLTKMEPNQLRNAVIHESYYIPENVTDTAKLSVETNYLGLEAQRILSRIQDNGMEKLSRDYLEYYQRQYPDIAENDKLTFSSDDQTGAVTIKEQYAINNIFEDTKKGFEIDFYASDIRSALYKPDAVDRNAPMALTFPKKITNKITLQFEADNWEFDDDSFIEDNEFFKFTFSSEFKGQILTLNYTYQAKQDHVPQDQISTYLDARKKVRNNSSYGIIKYKDNESEAEDSEFTVESDYFVWYAGVFLVLLTLMIIDWRLFATSRQTSDTVRFQPISYSKFYFLSLFSMGMYTSYWIYRNWLLIESRDNRGMWPIARGIFSAIWLYPLYLEFQKFNADNNNATKLISKSTAVFIALFYFGFSAIGAYSNDVEFWLVMLLVTPLLFYPLISFVNKTSIEKTDFDEASKLGFRHLFLTLMMLPILLLEAGRAIHLTPSGEAITGDKLWAHEIKYLQRQRIITPAEHINYFYSDAVISVRNDGNGFTDNVVFSYWMDEKSGFVSETAAFSEIKKIDVEYSEDDLTNTVVTITRKDDTDFLLFVSAIEKLDKVFVDELNKLWKGHLAEDSRTVD